LAPAIGILEDDIVNLRLADNFPSILSLSISPHLARSLPMSSVQIVVDAIAFRPSHAIASVSGAASDPFAC
jgi:hypothetical protein